MGGFDPPSSAFRKLMDGQVEPGYGEIFAAQDFVIWLGASRGACE